MAGTLSYFPTARKRMLEELPDDSELRKMLEEQDESVAKKNPPFTPHHVLQQREKNEFPQLPKRRLLQYRILNDNYSFYNRKQV